MNELAINYGISKRLKIISLIAGSYLGALSIGVSIFRITQHKIDFYFYAGIIGILLAVLLILTVTMLQHNLQIIIDNEAFRLDLPAQKVKGSILWESVTKVGIGLSYLTMQTNIGKNYKIDLENLKYKDLRDIKTRLIEICEAKKIPYSNM
jgi:hypothetical protein